MNKILKITFFTFLSAFFIAGCTKEGNKIYFEGGTAPTLTATEGANVEYANADQVALTLGWTNPGYEFTTGISSQDVNYNIEIDTVGSDFSKPYVVVVSKELTYSFQVSAINDILLNQLNLQVGIPHTLEIKVISSLVNNAEPLESNSIQIVATPYSIPPKVNPPTSGELYITGSATNGGWMVGGGVGVPGDQQFTKIDELHFTLTLNLIGGQQFLFIPVNGDWSNKFACKKTADQPLTGGEFGYNFSDNFPAPAESGNYKIDVDFQKGKYTVTKQ